MTTFLAVAIVVETALVVLLAVGFVRYRRARRTATACDFPGCAQARDELRALAAEHEHVPSRAVLQVVEGVEMKENQ